LITLLVKATIVAKLMANSRQLAEAVVTINVVIAITELDELVAMLGTMSTKFKTKVTQLGLDFDTEDSPSQVKALNANESLLRVWTDLFYLGCRPDSMLARFTLGYIIADPLRFGLEHSNYNASSDYTDVHCLTACLCSLSCHS
jgi:hypothetical protein